MCNAWNHPLDCTCGWGGDGHLGGRGQGNSWGTHYEPAPANAVWSCRDSYAAPTKCPNCGGAVYFVRHNGGSVWLDEIGWPWPRHACFDDKPEPNWSSYLRAHAGALPYRLPNLPQNSAVAGSTRVTLFIGLVVATQWLRDLDGQTVIGLAVDGGHLGRRIGVIKGDCTAEYFLGCIAIFDDAERKMITTRHKIRTLLPVSVTPEQLGLPANWLVQFDVI